VTTTDFLTKTKTLHEYIH